MPRYRLPIALAAGALLTASVPAAATAATHRAATHRAQDAVVLQLSGRSLRVVNTALAVHSYRITGPVPAHVRLGSRVVFIPQGGVARSVRAAGHVTRFSYVARVSGVSRGAVTLVLGSGLRHTYRFHHRQAAAVSARTLPRGARALVTVTVGARGARGVTVKRAAGYAQRAERDVTGTVTSVAAHGTRATVLTSSGIRLSLRLARGAGRILATCHTAEVLYRTHKHVRTATLVALSGQSAVSGCGALRGGNGFVTAVASGDRWIAVRTATGGKLTLKATTRALRRIVDRVSVTDYVDFTARGGTLATLHDTSGAKTGEVTAISRRKHAITVHIPGLGVVTMHATHTGTLAGVNVGDSLNVDYYRTATGPFVLVNCDDNGPARSGGNGGGPLHGGSAGSAGSAGSSGDAGSAGSAGAGG